MPGLTRCFSVRRKTSIPHSKANNPPANNNNQIANPNSPLFTNPPPSSSSATSSTLLNQSMNLPPPLPPNYSPDFHFMPFTQTSQTPSGNLPYRFNERAARMLDYVDHKIRIAWFEQSSNEAGERVFWTPRRQEIARLMVARERREEARGGGAQGRQETGITQGQEGAMAGGRQEGREPERQEGGRAREGSGKDGQGRQVGESTTQGDGGVQESEERSSRY